MLLMDKVFTVVMPLFAMIFAGYWIVRIGVIGKETVKGLVGVVFWLFLMLRGTTYLGWIHTRQGTPTAIEMAPMLIDRGCRLAREYLRV